MGQFLEQFSPLGSWVTMLVLIVLAVILLAGVTVTLASVMRRLLGVPVGWPRTIAVSLVVVLLTGGLFHTVVAQFHTDGGGSLSGLSPTAGLILLAIALLWTLGFGAAALMVLELIAPTGSWPGLLVWLADRGDRRARNRRYREVLAVFVRHGLTSGMRGFGRFRGHDSQGDRQALRRTARSLRTALEESGTTFVKLGQNLSTRTDVLPPEFTDELSRLQTEASPEPWEDIRAALEDSLGRDPEQVFARVDPAPLASASVAQVHGARLHDGTEVVLKIQRPGTREEVSRDSDIVMRLCGWLDRNTEWGHNLGIRQLAARFTESLAEELDYRTEAANMRDLEFALAEGPLLMPRVHEEYSSTRLLVMDLLEGVPIGRAGAQLSRLPTPTRVRLGEELLVSVMHQIMRYGVFHSDIHPGNVLLMPGDGGDGPRLGLLDFGAVGRLDVHSQQQLAHVFAAVDHGDASVLADALVDLLGRPDQLDDRALEREVGDLLVRYRNGWRGGSAFELFGRLMTMIVANRFEVPAGVAAAFRALAGVEGTLSLISPDIELVEVARTVGADVTRDQFRPDGLRAVWDGVLLEAMPLLRKLPRRISHLTEDLHDGRLSVNVRVLAHGEDRNFITRLIQQFTIAVLAGFCVLGGVVLIAFGEGGPALTDYLTWQTALGYIVLFAGFMLSLRTVTLVLYHGNRDSLAG